MVKLDYLITVQHVLTTRCPIASTLSAMTTWEFMSYFRNICTKPYDWLTGSIMI